MNSGVSKASILFFCFFVFGIRLYSYDIHKIGIENGLSNNNVVSIAQDRKGFIWICTKDGLNRFEGNSFKIFKKNDGGNSALTSNVLNYVYADKNDDIIWIATEKNGIDAYYYKTKTFKHYGHDHTGANPNTIIADGVTQISSDSKGNLWFATYWGGLDYFDKKTETFTHYNLSNVQGLGSNYNWTLYVENDETIYAGHVNDGFSIVNLKTKTAINFRHDPKNPSSLCDNTVTYIFKDSQNNIWIGTRNGLTLFDPLTYQIKNFKNDPNNENSLSNNYVKTIIQSNDYKLWIGTDGGGVNILDLSAFSKNKDPKEVHFEHLTASKTSNGLSSLSVQTLFQDSFGNIWLGGYGGGLNFVPRTEPFFKKITYLPVVGNVNSLDDNNVYGLCTDLGNNIWVANSLGGIAIYNKENKVESIRKIGNQTEKWSATCIYKDKSNDIWLGTDNGKIFVIDQKNKSLKRQLLIDGLMENSPIYGFFEDSKQNVWISTDLGLYVYNKTSGLWKNYNSENSELIDNLIRAVSEDKDGNIWVGTVIGRLLVFDQSFKVIANHGNNYDLYSVNQIYRDSKDRMWVCSQNDLFLFPSDSRDSVYRFNRKFGLNETDVRAIVEGKTSDEFWISTTNGITYIDLKSNKVNNFFVSDNIVMGDYLRNAVAKTSDGTIYFGSQNGITLFNQVLRNNDDKVLPKIEFSSFLVTNNQKNINEFIEIPFSDTMELEYHQNSFQINFNTLDYALSDKIEFAFQMKGLDDDWYFIDKDKRVTFRNLKPGNYTFNVKSRLHNKEWAGDIKSMHVRILPPLWLTWWAKLVYYLILTGLVLLIIRFYTNKIKIENDLLFEKRSRQQEHDLNEEKLKFFTNIAHELRTPMTLILGPLEDLIAEENLSPEVQKKLTSIQRVANRLLHLINQILEFRKTQTKSRKLKVVKDNIVKYVYEIGLKYKELNQNKEVDFKISLPGNQVELFFDPEVITIIIDNLLSNAFKYCPKGTIELKLQNETYDSVNYTEITVTDTGYGISDEDMPFIFERYYQARNASHPVKGTGIGLALVENLVQLHEAQISVQSQLNVGTTFTVKFITNNSYPDVLHISSGDHISESQELETVAEKVILVVDDNQEIVDYISESLVNTYTVLTAENGKHAIEIACEKLPDIVICDIMMPVMDGIEFCKIMKADLRTSHIPIIFLTAKDSALDKSEGYNAGADSYITKPFSISLLKSRLNNIFETRKKLATVYSSSFKSKKIFFNESTSQLDKEFLEKLNAIIEKNLEEEEMNISNIASQLNMSHSTLYRKIKALTNLTANEYIRKIRINVGEQLLITNQYSISEIMYRIGINSSSYFRQCFKDEFGMNPSEYLQKLKNEQV